MVALKGLLCDLLWSDPDKDVQGWSENDRGVSFTFGADIVSKFLQKHDMDLICRAHQVRKRSNVDESICSCHHHHPFQGGRGRIRILCKTTIGYTLFCTKLLWRI